MEKTTFRKGDRVMWVDAFGSDAIGGEVVDYDPTASHAPNHPWRVTGYVTVAWDDGERQSYTLEPLTAPGLANIRRV